MQKKSFSLAEVLITLTIVGVIAAATIPTLIAKHEEASTLDKVLKLYSTINQAYQAIQVDHGPFGSWTDYDYRNIAALSETYSAYVADLFRPYLKIVKDCGYNEGCFPNITYKKFNNTDSVNFLTNVYKRYMVKLADGSAVAFLGGYRNIVIYTDVNGDKGPNTFGKDVFQFNIFTDFNNKFVVPTGAESENYMEQCYSGGYACAQWVVTRKNFNYWHCNDLVPGVKESCGK